MCDNCGCGQSNSSYTVLRPGEEINSPRGDDSYHNHPHHHNHDDENEHHSQKIVINQDILQKNNLIAERNRGYLEAKNILTLNLVSSPGSGKTCLIERTIKDLSKEINFFIIEGDQQTTLDAERIQNAGSPVVQINTGNGCHLDAEMINKAITKLEIVDRSVLIIENVGNLVCPSSFDLGESFRVVIISVTEGDDKPLKYPTIFYTSNICIINKTDLLPYVDFNVNKCKEFALRINHHLQFFDMSVKSGEGLENWYFWLRERYKKVSQHPKP
jgi:hydrogenase nickel incorporation protein HypB